MLERRRCGSCSASSTSATPYWSPSPARVAAGSPPSPISSKASTKPANRPHPPSTTSPSPSTSAPKPTSTPTHGPYPHEREPMTKHPRPVMHGRDHATDGPDPIPNLAEGLVIADEGVALPAEPELNFTGGGVQASW